MDASPGVHGCGWARGSLGAPPPEAVLFGGAVLAAALGAGVAPAPGRAGEAPSRAEGELGDLLRRYAEEAARTLGVAAAVLSNARHHGDSFAQGLLPVDPGGFDGDRPRGGGAHSDGVCPGAPRPGERAAGLRGLLHDLPALPLAWTLLWI